MFELMTGITGLLVLVNSLLAINSHFNLKPAPVRRSLRNERPRSLKSLSWQ